MLRIVCTGDSHTWGQGAKGAVECLGKKVVAGELRPVVFETESYVNRLRRSVEALTGSHSVSLRRGSLAEAFGGEICGDSMTLDGNGKKFVFDGELVRLFFEAREIKTSVGVVIDGALNEISLDAYDGDRPHRLYYFHCPAGSHTLSLVPGENAPALYCAEFYGGPCAVVNAGVGSTSTNKYLDGYFDSYVRAARPDVILAEAHTVNDWLTGVGPEQYAADLRRLLAACRSLCSKVALLTVVPVGGKQIWTDPGSSFSSLADASRKVALEDGLPLADANIRLASLGLPELKAEWLDDNWHPNERGHALYADELFAMLVNHKWI
ncbi:MAG: SGNH/GDSL hydrolase family protein [Clostridia bacterium]|nr:SGNH/GDSL hydrolase family protein [Clostridia bacterium]